MASTCNPLHSSETGISAARLMTWHVCRAALGRIFAFRLHTHEHFRCQRPTQHENRCRHDDHSNHLNVCSAQLCTLRRERRANDNDSRQRKRGENGITLYHTHAFSRHRNSSFFSLAWCRSSLFSDNRINTISTKHRAKQPITADALPFSHLRAQSNHSQNAHAVSFIFLN